MARCNAPENLKSLFSLRLANIPDSVKTDDLIADCKAYGPIGDFYRPINLHKHIPSPYAFVRYFTEEDAAKAKACLHGKQYGDNVLSVFNANRQDSLFTQDTGFITNEAFDIPKVEVNHFESAMPSSHYEVKRRQQLLEVDRVYSVKVSDVPLEVKKEQLEELFSAHGEVSSVCYPSDLHTLRPRGFAFVRFVREDCAHSAACELNGHFMGGYRPITVAVVHAAPRYFSQDESTETANRESHN